MAVPSPVSQHRPSASRLGALTRLGCLVARISALGLLFNRPHRLLPPTVRLGGAGVSIASALFFAAAIARRCLVEGSSPAGVLGAVLLTYCVLLLVSAANRAAELTLCLSISAGVDAVASALAVTTFIDIHDPTTQAWLFRWELAAGFVALLQLHVHRLRRLGEVRNPDRAI